MQAVHAKHSAVYEDIAFFSLSIMINAFGNALTVSLNLGSALWTASSVNLTQVSGIPLDVTLFLFGAGVILINALILHRLDWHRVIGNLIFMIPFSYLIELMDSAFIGEGINQLPLLLRIILDILGICCIAMGISLYQRVNLMLHPCDDLMQIIRFRYFKGNATIAQLVTFSPPIVIIFACLLAGGKLYAINVGTLFALIFQGSLVGVCDKLVFPSLKHERLEENAVKQPN